MSILSGILDFSIRMFPGLVLGSVAFALLRGHRMARLRDSSLHSPPLRESALFLFSIYCGGLSILTLTPRWFHWMNLFQYRSDTFSSFFCIGTLNLTLFHTFHLDPWSLMILVGNIIMFLPIGFFPALLTEKFSIPKSLLFGLVSTLFIETFQLFIGRSFDIDDIFLNLLGILLGRLLLCLFPDKFISCFRPLPLK